MYNAILIDVMNLCYRLYDKDSESSIKKIDNKYVYKNLLKDFITKVDSLEKVYALKDTQIYLLFDNPMSRDKIHDSFRYVNRNEVYNPYKANRIKDKKKEFFNTLNIIKYYYILNSKRYHTIKVQNLEADDFVKIILEQKTDKDDRVLLVTNDVDWCRYISDNVYYYPDFSKEPANAPYFERKYNYKPTEFNLVLNKTLFGDKSDNIPSVCSSSDKHFEEFKMLISELKSIEEFWKAFHKGLFDTNIYTKIKDKERQLQINFAMTSIVNVHKGILKSHLTTGRDSKLLTNLKNLIFEVKLIKPFSFSSLNKPRR